MIRVIVSRNYKSQLAFSLFRKILHTVGHALDVAGVNAAVDENVLRPSPGRNGEEEKVSEADAVHAHSQFAFDSTGGSFLRGLFSTLFCGRLHRLFGSSLGRFRFCCHGYNPKWIRPKSAWK